MKRILVVVTVVVVLIVGVLVVGMMLPQNHTATRIARLSAPPETVWGLITNVSEYPRWRKSVDAVEELPARDGRIAWREISGSDRMAYEAVTSERPVHFVSHITDRGLPFGGSWDYRIVADGTGSKITITENGEVYNPVFRFVSRFVMGHTSSIDKYLGDLAAKFGDSYKPDAT